MEDVVAADSTRIPWLRKLLPGNKLWSLETRSVKKEPAKAHGRREEATSHVGEVATMAVVSGVLFPPLALLGGFSAVKMRFCVKADVMLWRSAEIRRVKVVAAATTP